MSEYYVYVYFDPRIKSSFKYNDLEFEYEPFYVGKGKNLRMYDHLKHTYRSYKVNKIKAIRKAGLEPLIIKYKEGLTNEEAFTLEMELIKKIGRLIITEGPLTNITEGGSNPILFGKDNSWNGRKRTEIHSQAILEGLKKYYDNPFNKAKSTARLKKINENRIWERFRGQHHSDETKKSIGEKNALKQRGEGNSQFGSYWITNGIESKKTKDSEIPEGWYKGRKIKK